jgi:hypothetical protein
MSVRSARLEHLLSVFALTIFDTVGLGVPLSIVIILICCCLEALSLI